MFPLGGTAGKSVVVDYMVLPAHQISTAPAPSLRLKSGSGRDDAINPHPALDAKDAIPRLGTPFISG